MQQLLAAAAVGLGGFIGALARFGLTALVHRRISPTTFPAGTLFVNVLGCLAIGFLMTVVVEREGVSRTTQLLVITGVLGSLTTFSTFGWETAELLRVNRAHTACLYVGANLVAGLAAVWIGSWIARAMGV